MRGALKLALAMAFMIGLMFMPLALAGVEKDLPPETKATGKIRIVLQAAVPQAVVPYAKTMGMTMVDPSSINGHPIAVGTFTPDHGTTAIADKMLVAFCFDAARIPNGVELHLTYVVAATIFKGDKQEVIYFDLNAPCIKESKGTPVSTEIVPQK